MIGRDSSGSSSRSELTPVESFGKDGFTVKQEKRPKSALDMAKNAQTYLRSTSIHGLQYWGKHQGPIQ